MLENFNKPLEPKISRSKSCDDLTRRTLSPGKDDNPSKKSKSEDDIGRANPYCSGAMDSVRRHWETQEAAKEYRRSLPEGNNIVTENLIMAKKLGRRDIYVGENAANYDKWEAPVAFKLNNDGNVQFAENPGQLVKHLNNEGYKIAGNAITERELIKQLLLSNNGLVKLEKADQLELLELDKAKQGLQAEEARIKEDRRDIAERRWGQDYKEADFYYYDRDNKDTQPPSLYFGYKSKIKDDFNLTDDEVAKMEACEPFEPKNYGKKVELKNHTLYESREKIKEFLDTEIKEIKAIHESLTGVKIPWDKFYVHMVDNEIYITQKPEFNIDGLIQEQRAGLSERKLDALRNATNVEQIGSKKGLTKLREIKQEREKSIKETAKNIGRLARKGDGYVDVATLDKFVSFKVTKSTNDNQTTIKSLISDDSIDNQVQVAHQPDDMINHLVDRLGIPNDQKADFRAALSKDLKGEGDFVEYEKENGQKFKIEILALDKAEQGLKQEADTLTQGIKVSAQEVYGWKWEGEPIMHKVGTALWSDFDSPKLQGDVQEDFGVKLTGHQLKNIEDGEPVTITDLKNTGNPKITIQKLSLEKMHEKMQRKKERFNSKIKIIEKDISNKDIIQTIYEENDNSETKLKKLEKWENEQINYLKEMRGKYPKLEFDGDEGHLYEVTVDGKNEPEYHYYKTKSEAEKKQNAPGTNITNMREMKLDERVQYVEKRFEAEEQVKEMVSYLGRDGLCVGDNTANYDKWEEPVAFNLTDSGKVQLAENPKKWAEYLNTHYTIGEGKEDITAEKLPDHDESVELNARDGGQKVTLNRLELDEAQAELKKEVSDLEKSNQELAVRTWGPEFEGKKLYARYNASSGYAYYIDQTAFSRASGEPATLDKMNADLERWHKQRSSEIQELYQDRTGHKIINPDKSHIYMVAGEPYITQVLTAEALTKQGAVDMTEEKLQGLIADSQVKQVWEVEGLEGLEELAEKQKTSIKVLAKNTDTKGMKNGKYVKADTLNEVIPFRVTDNGTTPKGVQLASQQADITIHLVKLFGIEHAYEREDFEELIKDRLKNGGDSVEYEKDDGQKFKIEIIPLKEAESELKKANDHLELQKELTKQIIELEKRNSTNPDHQNLEGEVLHAYKVDIDDSTDDEPNRTIETIFYYKNQADAVQDIPRATNGKTVKSVEYISLKQRLEELENKYRDDEKAFNTEQIQEMVGKLGRSDIRGRDLSNLDNLVFYTRDDHKVDFVNSQDEVPEGSDVKVLTSLDQARKALEIEKADVERETQNFAATAFGPKGKGAFTFHEQGTPTQPRYFQNREDFNNKYSMPPEEQTKLEEGENFECREKTSRKRVKFEQPKLYQLRADMVNKCKELSTEVKRIYGVNNPYQDSSGNTADPEMVRAYEVNNRVYITGNLEELEAGHLAALKGQGVDVPQEHIDNLEALKKDGKVKSIGLQDAVSRLKNEKRAKLAEEVGEGEYAYEFTFTKGPRSGISYTRFYKNPRAMAKEWGLSQKLMETADKYKSKDFKVRRLSPKETIAALEKKKSDPDRMSTQGKIEAIAKEVIRERLKNSSVYENKKDRSRYHVGIEASEERYEKVEDTGKAYHLREQWIDDEAKNASIYRTSDNRICIASDQKEAEKLLESDTIYEVIDTKDALILLIREKKAFNELQTLLKQDLNLGEQPNIYAYEYTVKGKGKPDIIRTAVASNQKDVEDKLFPENKKLLGKKKTLDGPDVRPISYERALHWYLSKEVYGQEVNEKDISGCKITIDGKEQPLEMVTSAKELSDRLSQRQGYPIPADQLDGLWSAGNNEVKVNHGSTTIEIKRVALNTEQTRQIVAQTMDNIQETHQNIYGKPANPGNIGFMVKVGDAKLQKILGMKSDEEFFTAARLENEVRQHNGLSGEYHTAIATMEPGAQHVLDLFGTRVEITRPGLARTEQKLEKRQAEIIKSLEQLTNKTFTNIPRAFRIAEVYPNGNGKLGKLRSDTIDVVDDLQSAHNIVKTRYNVKADIGLKNIEIGEEIKFTDNNGGYVVYERISLNDAINMKTGINMKNTIEQLVYKYNAVVLGNELDAMGKSNIWHPMDMSKQQDEEKRKTEAKSILVGTKPIKDWKTAFAANVKSAANDKGKFMLAEDEESMRKAFPDKYIEPLSRGEAYKRLAALKNDQQAPQRIRDHRNKIIGYGVKKACIRQNPAMEELWDKMEKEGEIKYRLTQDRNGSGNEYVFRRGNTYYMGTSRHEAAEQLGVPIDVIDKAKRGEGGEVVMLPRDSRRTQRIIEKGKIELVNDASQMWYVFQRTDSDGGKTWYVTDNREYNNTFEGKGTELIAGQHGGMHISQNDLKSIGVKEAEIIDHRTLKEKAWEGLKAVPNIIMGTKDKDKNKGTDTDDSEDKDNPVDYSYLDSSYQNFDQGATQYSSYHPEIPV